MKYAFIKWQGKALFTFIPLLPISRACKSTSTSTATNTHSKFVRKVAIRIFYAGHIIIVLIKHGPLPIHRGLLYCFLSSIYLHFAKCHVIFIYSCVRTKSWREAMQNIPEPFYTCGAMWAPLRCLKMSYAVGEMLEERAKVAAKCLCLLIDTRKIV